MIGGVRYSIIYGEGFSACTAKVQYILASCRIIQKETRSSSLFLSPFPLGFTRHRAATSLLRLLRSVKRECVSYLFFCRLYFQVQARDLQKSGGDTKR